MKVGNCHKFSFAFLSRHQQPYFLSAPWLLGWNWGVVGRGRWKIKSERENKKRTRLNKFPSLPTRCRGEAGRGGGVSMQALFPMLRPFAPGVPSAFPWVSHLRPSCASWFLTWDSDPVSMNKGPAPIPALVFSSHWGSQSYTQRSWLWKWVSWTLICAYPVKQIHFQGTPFLLCPLESEFTVPPAKLLLEVVGTWVL